jgi:predicted acylesterase/phospholipase RssA
VTVGSIGTVGAARLHADFVIAPPVDAIGLMDWKALGLVVEAGRQAARELLAANPDLPSRLAI